jgi:hypothetical protein
MKKIFNKIRKHGILGSFKISVRIISMYVLFWSFKIPWPLRPMFYYNLLRLILIPFPKKKRILGIYDLKVLPWDVGDPLVFIETLNVLKIENKAEEVDVCIIYDRDCPAYREKDVSTRNITLENAQDYILEFIPLFSTCQYLGSVYQFNSRKECHRFLKINLGRYDIFPSLGTHLGEKDMFRAAPPILNPMHKFYNIHGYIPYLRIGKREEAWAQWLYINNLPEGTIPVTLSLKRTSHRIENNVDPAVWLSFIDRCKLEFPEVVFVVVGLRDEVFAGLRNRSNVFIAKDFGTSIIEDLALIRASLMYMGTSSGVNVIAMFSELPYLITQFGVSNYLRHGLKPGDNFSFMSDVQKIFSAEITVTPEFLFTEFKALYSKLDKNKWRSVASETAREKHGHPTARVLD